MSLEKRVYSVLIVSASEHFSSALLTCLHDALYDPVRTVSCVSAARRALLDREYDMVLINSPLADEPGLRLATDLCAETSSSVLLFVRSDLYAGVYEQAAAGGVFTMPKPVPKQAFTQALEWMISARERLRRFEIRTQSLEEKMADIRLCNRAKLLLISELGMSETGAHRYLEKNAMDRCVSKETIAREIINTYSGQF